MTPRAGARGRRPPAARRAPTSRAARCRAPRGPSPASAEQRQRERHQQHHVLAAHRQQVGEPGVAPVLARGLVDRARPRRAPCRGRARPRRAGRPAATARSARPRMRSSAPARPPRRRPVARDAVEHELARDAAAAQMGGEVEGGRRRPGRPSAQPDAAARPRARRRPSSAGGQRRPARRSQQQRGAAQRPGRDRDLRGRAEADGRGGVRRWTRSWSDRPVADTRRGCVERREARVPASRSTGNTQRGARSEPASAVARQAASQRSASDRRRPPSARRGCGRRASASPAATDAPPVRRERARRPLESGRARRHGWSASRSVARRFSPMPSTSAARRASGSRRGRRGTR